MNDIQLCGTLQAYIHIYKLKHFYDKMYGKVQDYERCYTFETMKDFNSKI